MEISGHRQPERHRKVIHPRKDANEAEFPMNIEDRCSMEVKGMQASSRCKVGLQTSKHNNLSVEQQLDFCIKKGFSVFEIFFDGFWPSDISKERRKEIKKMAAEQGITLQVHGPIEHVEKWKKALEETVEFCHDVGSTMLTLHPGAKDVPVYQEIFGLAQDKGIRIGLENYREDGAYYSPEKLTSMLNRFSAFPNAGITFDVGHANIEREAVSYLNAIPSEKIINIHIHDNDGKEDQHLPVGKGNIDFPALLQTLKQRHYRGNLIIERWEPGLESARYITTMWDKG
jgi:sugar phosphate isomerase/epimerase